MPLNSEMKVCKCGNCGHEDNFEISKYELEDTNMLSMEGYNDFVAPCVDVCRECGYTSTNIEQVSKEHYHFLNKVDSTILEKLEQTGISYRKYGLKFYMIAYNNLKAQNIDKELTIKIGYHVHSIFTCISSILCEEMYYNDMEFFMEVIGDISSINKEYGEELLELVNDYESSNPYYSLLKLDILMLSLNKEEANKIIKKLSTKYEFNDDLKSYLTSKGLKI